MKKIAISLLLVLYLDFSTQLTIADKTKPDSKFIILPRPENGIEAGADRNVSSVGEVGATYGALRWPDHSGGGGTTNGNFPGIGQFGSSGGGGLKPSGIGGSQSFQFLFDLVDFESKVSFDEYLSESLYSSFYGGFIEGSKASLDNYI